MHHDPLHPFESVRPDKEQEPLFVSLSMFDWISITLFSSLVFWFTKTSIAEAYHALYFLSLMLPAVLMNQINEKRLSTWKRLFIGYLAGITFFTTGVLVSLFFSNH